jgi:hypothetical protein
MLPGAVSDPPVSLWRATVRQHPTVVPMASPSVGATTLIRRAAREPRETVKETAAANEPAIDLAE